MPKLRIGKLGQAQGIARATPAEEDTMTRKHTPVPWNENGPTLPLEALQEGVERIRAARSDLFDANELHYQVGRLIMAYDAVVAKLAAAEGGCECEPPALEEEKAYWEARGPLAQDEDEGEREHQAALAEDAARDQWEQENIDKADQEQAWLEGGDDERTRV